MSDESIKLSAKTWGRAIDSVNKVGYSDGVVDAQAASFQFSFDMGYKQGIEFGFKYGLMRASKQHTQRKNEDRLCDPRRINCQICLHNDKSNENIVNLYNRQLEKNNDYFSMQLRS